MDFCLNGIKGIKQHNEQLRNSTMMVFVIIPRIIKRFPASIGNFVAEFSRRRIQDVVECVFFNFFKMFTLCDKRVVSHIACAEVTYNKSRETEFTRNNFFDHARDGQLVLDLDRLENFLITRDRSVGSKVTSTKVIKWNID